MIFDTCHNEMLDFSGYSECSFSITDIDGEFPPNVIMTGSYYLLHSCT